MANRGVDEAFSGVDGDDVIVVGHDAWTDPVIEELRSRDADVTVLVTDAGAAERLRERGLDVVHAEDLDEASFQAAGVGDADVVFVATLDEQRNVLAVLTAMNVEHDARVATFAREASDVSKLEAAGADVVISLGEVVAELLVEVALTDRSVDAVLEELTAAR